MGRVCVETGSEGRLHQRAESGSTARLPGEGGAILGEDTASSSTEFRRMARLIICPEFPGKTKGIWGPYIHCHLHLRFLFVAEIPFRASAVSSRV